MVEFSRTCSFSGGAFSRRGLHSLFLKGQKFHSYPFALVLARREAPINKRFHGHLAALDNDNRRASRYCQSTPF